VRLNFHVCDYFVACRARLRVVVAEQGLALALGLTTLEWVLAEDTWDGKSEGSEEEDGHDDESLDPLHSDHSGEELSDAKS
jgi:hypothetical protein